MNVQLVNPWMLYFVWLVPVFAGWCYVVGRRRARALETFVSADMRRKLQAHIRPDRSGWQAGLVSFGLLLLLLAGARPQWGMKEVKVFQRGRNLIIALDVSRSMLAKDVHPNRLERAKADILDLIAELQGDRAGLLAFRGKAVLLCPLTLDYAFLRQSLDAVGLDSAPRGETDIGDAIRKAMDAFESDGGAHNAIILISDGEDLAGDAVDAAAEARKKNIPIFTVGIGDPRGARIPSGDPARPHLAYQGNEVLTRLDNESLLAISRATDGAYIPLGMASTATVTLGTLYKDHLRRISTQDLEESLQRRAIERYQLFLLPGFLCLLAAAFLSRGRLASASRRKSDARGPSLVLSATVGVIVLLFSPALLPGETNGVATNAVSASSREAVPPGRTGARLAQKYYRAGEYQKAAETYLSAAGGATRKSRHDFEYNAAVSLFKAGQYREAADLLQTLLSAESQDSPRTAMGLGESLYHAARPPEESNAENLEERRNQLRASGEAFKLATRGGGANRSARENLAVVLSQLPEAEEQALLARIMEQHGARSPSELAAEMLQNQRNILKEHSASSTNDTPSRIRELEALADRQKANAHLWIPLKQKIMEALSAGGQDQAQAAQSMATAEGIIEATRDHMLGAAAGFRDLDPEGYAASAATLAEAGTYQLWKAIADYGGILKEDLHRQTNAIVHTQEVMARRAGAGDEDQAEALNLTRLFKDRFSASLPETDAAQVPPPGEEAGGSPAMTPETREKILSLTDQAASVQENVMDHIQAGDPGAALERQRTAYRLLKEIEELLPRQSQQQQQDKDQQKDSQEKDQDKQQNQQDQQNQDEQESQPQDPPSDPQPQDQEQQKTDEEKDSSQEDGAKEDPKDSLTAEQVRELLEKAIEREKQHEAEKRQLRGQVPMSPSERDW